MKIQRKTFDVSKCALIVLTDHNPVQNGSLLRAITSNLFNLIDDRGKKSYIANSPW